MTSCYKGHEQFIRMKCLNQIIRPKVKLPKWMLPKGIGDCTVCQPCLKNLECKGYIPVSIICGEPQLPEDEKKT